MDRSLTDPLTDAAPGTEPIEVHMGDHELGVPRRWDELPDSFTLPLLKQAVEASGYPFQTRVAAILDKWFHVEEEWPYLDRTTRQLRTIDLLATHELWKWGVESQRKPLRPSVSVLVECKSSKSPWVFFRTVSRTPLSEFPIVAGLPVDEIIVDAHDNEGVWVLSPQQLLEFQNQPFVVGPPHVASFTKAIRKGTAAELTGSEPFLSVVEPLVSATAHYAQARAPLDTYVNFEPSLAVSLFVTDAPLVLATIKTTSRSLSVVPWVRVIRHEYVGGHPRHDVREWPIDCLHVDFLPEYIAAHLLPFARLAARRMRKQPLPLMTGFGLATGRPAPTIYRFRELRPDPEHPFVTEEERRIVEDGDRPDAADAPQTEDRSLT